MNDSSGKSISRLGNDAAMDLLSERVDIDNDNMIGKDTIARTLLNDKKAQSLTLFMRSNKN